MLPVPGQRKITDASWIQVPSVDMVMLVHEPNADMIGQHAGALSSVPRADTNWKNTLLDDRACKTRIVMHDASPPIPRRRGPCWKGGSYMCDGAGATVWAMRNNLLRCMKPIFVAGSAERGLLADAWVVAIIYGYRDGVDKLDEWDISLAEELGEDVCTEDFRGHAVQPHRLSLLFSSHADVQPITVAGVTELEAWRCRSFSYVNERCAKMVVFPVVVEVEWGFSHAWPCFVHCGTCSAFQL